MNYLKQVVRFENYTEANYLPPKAQLLYYKLLKINNRCGWKTWFQAANLTLMGMLGVSAEKTLIELRQKLNEAGLIEYQSGRKGSPTKYRIVSLDDEKACQITGFSEAQVPVKTSGETTDNHKQKEKNKECGYESHQRYRGKNQRRQRPEPDWEAERGQSL